MSSLKRAKKIEHLFLFLKEFHKLKTKRKYDADSYEKTLWLHDIPQEKECFSIIPKTASEDSRDSAKFDKWIKIKKPRRNPFPSPPAKISSWLAGDLKNPEYPPRLLSAIITAPPPDGGEMADKERESGKIFLEERPEIRAAFADWMRQKRIPWAEEERRLKAVFKAYNSLYEIYKKSESLGEVYQTILCIGLLSSKNKKGARIRRHIAATPVSIDFDSVTGSISVGPCEQGAELFLETDMLEESEKPGNCDEINSRLSEFSNDFWIKDEFYNQLKSFLNSYDPNGQFIKNFEKPVKESFSTLSISPALILRKRNEREFMKFYDAAAKNKDESSRPCLQSLIDEEPPPPSEAAERDEGVLHGKHYFPLPANAEQKKIIEKAETHSQVLVQGPPGTGKTHSIANLICHFLAQGKRILVTSQTDRALKVLKNKLPEGIKPLCVEILGRDQRSFQALKESFDIINSKYQNHDKKEMAQNIGRLEKKDNELKGEIADITARLSEIKRGETEKFEKKFGHWTGTPAAIASRVSEEREAHGWIKEFFNNSYREECPLSRHEAETFLAALKKIQGIPDAVLEEPIEWADQSLPIQSFQKKIQEEKDIKAFLTGQASSERSRLYEHINGGDLAQLNQQLDALCLHKEHLLQRKEEWVRQAFRDCLAGRDREWRYLHEETEKILDENIEAIKKADKVGKITFIKDESIPETGRDQHFHNLLNKCFEKYSPNEKRRWRGWLGPARKLKKVKIDGRPISSLEDAEKFHKYIISKIAFERIYGLWARQGAAKKAPARDFERHYHIFKDLCEPLAECLSAYKIVEAADKILPRFGISKPLWDSDSIKRESAAAKIAFEKRKLQTLAADFRRAASVLEPHKGQKSGLPQKLISAIKSRDMEEYKKALDQAHDLKSRQKDYAKACQIRKKLSREFYLKLREGMGHPLWERRLREFERAWAWRRADLWLEERARERSSQNLSSRQKDLRERQKQNMERLACQKAWLSLLSQITDGELSSLKGLIQSISKIGKGTGKSAIRHIKTAKKRMEECKTAVPAWIMPLYRVVENIKPSGPLFDIAIVDEASQIGPDGFLINYLAKKIIVSGDKEQISPDNIGIKDDEVESLKKKYLPQIKHSDYIGRDYSYYDYCEILWTKSHIQLREHFRCMPEIIQFSNRVSYSGAPLIPLRQYGSSRLPPLKRTFVPEAVSKIGSGRDPQNEKEAEAIADQIQKCVEDPAYTGKTFGIICLQGKSQVKVIEKALLQIDKIDKEELEERKIQVGSPYDFQGDERDVIFLSMAVAKDWPVAARVKETDKRRYNVAASRAKDQMHLFHSVEMSDLSNKEDYRRRLLEHFLAPAEALSAAVKDAHSLYKKIKEAKNKSHENAPAPFGSWFEARVYCHIRMRGYQALPQYKVSKFSIDMIIFGSKGRLAVECDGDYWHEGREGEDLERQQQLERCGWTFWRLKESAFNHNEEEALKSLWGKLDEMEIYPLENQPLEKLAS